MSGQCKFCKRCGLEFSTAAGDEICLNCQNPESAETAPPRGLGQWPKLGKAAKKKILIVDDEPAMAALLKSRLEANGYRVTEASDGDEGLCKIRSEKPDLVLLDVLMPGMTGYEVLKSMKKETGDIRKIPVIVMTGKRSMKDFFSPTEIHHILLKPFEPEELLVKVRELLERTADPLENS